MSILTKKELLFYAVTDRSWLFGRKLTEVVKQALDGGITCLQLREKQMAEDDFFREAVEIKKITEQYHVPLIIDDNVRLALQAKADGVHIGQQDMNPIAAREFLGKEKIIGVTARNVSQALKAEKNGAAYLGSGAAFTTKTKKDAIPMTEETMKAICESVKIPVVAIGGITYENMEQLYGRGISGIAVVSSLFAAEDIYQQAVKMRKRAEELFI
mgnify:CR=1 FL=1